MYNNNKILVVIPARGTSKEIPRKNSRLLGQKPLIAHVINTAKSSEYVDDVVVTTDDSKIQIIAEKYGANVIKISDELLGEDISVDAIVHDALIKKENLIFDEYDIIITIKPYSPLLKVNTLNKAIEKFDNFDLDTVVSVVNDTHSVWRYNEESNKYNPDYVDEDHVVFPPKEYRATGAILATRRRCISEETSIGSSIELMEISDEEGIDIKTLADWAVAENYVNKKRIAIIASASEDSGTGNIYRALSLASRLTVHDVLFILMNHYDVAIQMIEKENYPYMILEDKSEFYESLDKFSPEIVINNISDSSADYIQNLKERGYFVVNFGDLGEGSSDADLIFDAFCEDDINQGNIFVGHEYYLLRDELYYQRKKIIRHDVKNVLIAFEGEDSNFATEFVLNSLIKANFNEQIVVVLSAEFKNKEDIVEKYRLYPNIVIYEHVDEISPLFIMADIIFTSAGRQMYEICSLGVPCICIPLNETEANHTFANFDNGFINLGVINNLSEEDIINHFINLANNFDLREDLNKRMLSIDLKHGFNHTWNIIESQFNKFKLQK